MRILVMLLLLANLGFFAWQHWYGPEAARELPPGRIDTGSGQRLVLLDEGAPPPAPEAVAEKEPAVEAPQVLADSGAAEEDIIDDEPVAAPPVCATLGPFEQRQNAEIAHARLDGAGLRAAIRETGGQIRAGFWVYLPPFPSRDAAEDVEDALREKNVHDLFIVSDSGQQNAISLGLFSTPERADQRAAEIGRLGYAPRVAERFRDATVYWVDFIERPGDVLEPEMLGVMGEGRTLPEKRVISCADVAVAADPA